MWKKVIFAVLSIIFLVSAFPFRQATGQPTTLVSVEPANNFGLSLGENFPINITVSDVTDLSGWQFTLYYQTTVLNMTGFDEGPFLLTGGVSTFFLEMDFQPNYNATTGLITLADARITGQAGVNGSGTLATIHFTVIGSGASVLHLGDGPVYANKLADHKNHLIPFTSVDGQAYVGLVDVAIGEIDTPPGIAQGSMALINVTAQNRGQAPETFDVTLVYSGSGGSNPVDGTKTVIDLPAGEGQVLTFAWDTTPLQIGEYTLTATATQVMGEIDLNDNTLSVNVYVGIVNMTIINVNAKTSIPADTNGTDIQVTVQNNGQATETFNVTLTCNSQFVATQTASLDPGAIGTVTLNWNTTTLAYGNYTLQAYIPPLGFQESTVNFTWRAVITIPGDLTGDFTVGLVDLVTLAQSYGSQFGYPNWNPNADVDGNGKVGLTDLVLLAVHYGEHLQ
jgi:hypothetical protein